MSMFFLFHGAFPQFAIAIVFLLCAEYKNSVELQLSLFTHNFYARKQLLLSGHLSHRNSLCPSVCLTDILRTGTAIGFRASREH